MMQVEKIKEAFEKWIEKNCSGDECAFAAQYKIARQEMALGFCGGFLSALDSLDEKATDSGDAESFITALKGYGIMSNAHDSWFVPIDNGEYIRRHELKELLPSFVQSREKAAKVEALEELRKRLISNGRWHVETLDNMLSELKGGE